jgi:hypothetical protein
VTEEHRDSGHRRGDTFVESEDYRVWVDGEPVRVGHAAAGSFAVFPLHAAAQVEIEATKAPDSVIVRPLSRKIAARLEGSRIAFSIDSPCHLMVETDTAPPVFIGAFAPEDAPPTSGDPGVLRFGGGAIHEIGELEISSGSTVYIEAGTVVRGVELRDVYLDGRKVTNADELDLYTKHAHGVRIW